MLGEIAEEGPGGHGDVSSSSRRSSRLFRIYFYILIVCESMFHILVSHKLYFYINIYKYSFLNVFVYL